MSAPTSAGSAGSAQNGHNENHNPRQAKSTSKKQAPATQHRSKSRDSRDKEPVEVYCRLKPLTSLSDLVCIHQVKDNIIKLSDPRSSKSDLFYTFKHVFPQTASQNDVFGVVNHPLVKDLVDGKNGLIFTYGITSSGKTFTVTGKPDNPGILPRSLDVLFNSIRDKQCLKYIFVPDTQNGFEIQSVPDAMRKRQDDRDAPKSAPGTPFLGSRTNRQRKTDMKDLLDWQKREKDTGSVELSKQNHKYAVFLSFVEIYNNYIYDLLDESVVDVLKSQSQQPRSKTLREDCKKRMFVAQGTEIEVCSADEAFEVFLKGIRRRKMAHTALNTESSRSHSVFNIRVVQAPAASDEEVIPDPRFVVSSQLSIVDLAGSERSNRTENMGERLREAGNINNSLMALRKVIDTLRDNQKTGKRSMVEYRESKLTHLFKSYFEGEGKIKMVICANPSADEYEETIHVMKFAETTQEVVINKATDPFKYLTNLNNFGVSRGIQFASLGNFGPPLPASDFSDPNNERAIPEWLDCLEERKNVRKRKTEELLQNQLAFRNQLAKMEQDNLCLIQQNQVYKSDLEAREAQVLNLERKFAEKESNTEGYQRKIATLQKEVNSLNDQLKEKDYQLARAEVEREKLKQRCADHVKSEQQRFKRIYEHQMAETESRLRAQNCLNQEKLHLVHEILTGDPASVRFHQDNMHCPRSPPASGSTVSTVTKTPSTPLSHKSPNKKSSRSTGARRSAAETEPLGHDPLEPLCLSPREGIPTGNMKGFRRSLSSGGEKWIDHRPPGTLDLGMVFKPKIKNKTSLSNLKNVSSSTIKQASNYALTHHTAEDDGGVSTQVFKGSVIPSVGGGAHVIFNDVEILKQSSFRSPTRYDHNGTHYFYQ